MKRKDEMTGAGDCGGGGQGGLRIRHAENTREDHEEHDDFDDFVHKSRSAFDDMMTKHKDIGHGDVIAFIVDLDDDDEKGKTVKKLLFDRDLDKLADAVRDHVTRQVVRNRLSEVIRRKGDKWVLYKPNTGKKKKPEIAGEFPTKVMAKRAELNRYPSSKDPEEIAKLRKQLAKMAQKPESALKKSKRRKKGPFGESMLRKVVSMMLNESLWDEVKKRLGSDVLSRDKTITSRDRVVNRAKSDMLDDAVSTLMSGIDKKSVKILVKDEDNDSLTLSAKVTGVDVGPIKLSISDDGSRVNVETSPMFEASLTKVDPKVAKSFRSEIALLQSSSLDATQLKKALDARESGLSKAQNEIDSFVAGLSPVQMVLLKDLLKKKYKSDKRR